MSIITGSRFLWERRENGSARLEREGEEGVRERRKLSLEFGCHVAETGRSGCVRSGLNRPRRYNARLFFFLTGRLRAGLPSRRMREDE